MKKLNLEEAHIPTYLKVLIYKASTGGVNSYSEVGYHLAIHLEDFLVHCRDENKAREDFEKDDIKVWVKKYCNHVLKYIPSRRRDNFFQGLEECLEERGNPF